MTCWRKVKQRFSVEAHESTIGKWLGELGLTRLQPRPVHPKKDPEAEATLNKTSADLVKQALLGTTAAKPFEICFQDEARVGQKETHAYKWEKVGSRPLMVRDLRQNTLCSRVWNTYDDILETQKVAWNWLIDGPDRIRSIDPRD